MSEVTNWRTDPKMQALKTICREHGFVGVVAFGFRANADYELFSYGVDGPRCKAMGVMGDILDTAIQGEATATPRD